MDNRFNDDNQRPENLSAGNGDADRGLRSKGEEKPGAEPQTSADSTTEALRAQLAEKDKELAELKDRYLRTLAENENARKRMRQQSEETIRIHRENLLRDLLPVVDNLERAVEAARGGGNGASIVQGVELVLRGMLDFLKGHEVTQIPSVGHPFDPQHHEAVDHIESQAHPANTVVNEFIRGYRIGDRMLRPARVSVAKRGTNSEGNGGDGGSGNGLENH
jgi:molecular chaperone GrpE